MYARADHSSPPIRTRPPLTSTRWTTTDFVPSRAAVPVRSAAGMCRCRLAIGRRTRSDGRERDGPEEEEARREDLADRKEDGPERPDQPRGHDAIVVPLSSG